MNVKSTSSFSSRLLCGAVVWNAAWAFPAVTALGRADEIADGARPARTITVKRNASRETAELRVEIKAVVKDGKLEGDGRLFFKWVSPGKGGDIESEIDETVRAEGSLAGDRVQLRIVSPQQLKYVVKKAPPPDPKVPLKDQVHVGSTGQWPLAIFDPWHVFEGTLVDGHFEHKGPQTQPSGVWTVATEMTMTSEAPALVERLTLGGRIEPGDVFRVAVGEAAVSISAVGSSPESAASQLAAAWNGGGSAERTGIAAVASGADVWLTADAPNNAFTCEIKTTEADGARSDGQTFASSTQFIAGGPGQGLWKKEIRHCGRLLATFYAREPSPTVGYFQSVKCPVCGVTVSGGEWSLVGR